MWTVKPTDEDNKLPILTHIEEVPSRPNVSVLTTNSGREELSGNEVVSSGSSRASSGGSVVVINGNATFGSLAGGKGNEKQTTEGKIEGEFGAHHHIGRDPSVKPKKQHGDDDNSTSTTTPSEFESTTDVGLEISFIPNGTSSSTGELPRPEGDEKNGASSKGEQPKPTETWTFAKNESGSVEHGSIVVKERPNPEEEDVGLEISFRNRSKEAGLVITRDKIDVDRVGLEIRVETTTPGVGLELTFHGTKSTTPKVSNIKTLCKI